MTFTVMVYIHIQIYIVEQAFPVLQFLLFQIFGCMIFVFSGIQSLLSMKS